MSLKLSGERGSSPGFTLLEVLVVLAVVFAILAFIAPTLAGLIQNDKVAETQQQAERIYRAIFGNPARGEFGYIGDMGRLPATLAELVDQGSQTAFHTADGSTEHVGRVGTGWRGPYLRSLFSNQDLLRDAWGQSFSYTDTGASAGQIISSGPDGILGNADDIKFPLHPPPTKGRLYVSVLSNEIPDPLGGTAKVYFPLNGEQSVTTTQKHHPSPSANQPDTFNGFAFENVPHGLHVLVVAHTGVGPAGCSTVTRTVPVKIHAGQLVVKEVRMLTEATAQADGNLTCTIPD